VAQRLVLERGRDSPDGYRGQPFGGPLQLLGPWALLCFRPRPRGACFVVCGFVRLIFIIFRKGCFPRLLGDPYSCPRQISTLRFQQSLNRQGHKRHRLCIGVCARVPPPFTHTPTPTFSTGRQGWAPKPKWVGVSRSGSWVRVRPRRWTKYVEINSTFSSLFSFFPFPVLSYIMFFHSTCLRHDN
jgi:hypothetical protein